MAKHKDVEFHVHGPDQHQATVYSSFNEAAAIAVARSASGEGKVLVDVIIWSRSGAKAYGGDDGVEQYDEDPEASVFERIVISADSKGRIA